MGHERLEDGPALGWSARRTTIQGAAAKHGTDGGNRKVCRDNKRCDRIIYCRGKAWPIPKGRPPRYFPAKAGNGSTALAEGQRVGEPLAQNRRQRNSQTSDRI